MCTEPNWKIFLPAKFCYCIKLHTGCIIMSVLGIVGRSWAGVGNGIGWCYIKTISYLHPWRPVVSILNGVIGIGSSCCLLYGILKGQHLMIKVYLTMTVLLISLLLISTIFGIITLSSDAWRSYYKTAISCRSDPDCLKTLSWTIYALCLDTVDFFAYIYF